MALTSQDLIFGYRFNQINFAVPGPQFPGNTGASNKFIIESSEAQVININWGDGTFEEVNLVAGSEFKIKDNYHVFPKKVTLSGTSGTGNITFGADDFLVEFTSDLSTTASKFVTDHATALEALDIEVTANADVLTFVFTGIDQNVPIFSNLTGDLGGTIEDSKTTYNISFTFENPESVTTIQTLNVNLGQIFPSTVTKLIGLENLILKNTVGNFGVTTFPEDLSTLTKLKFLRVDRGELPRIDESILALPNLEQLSFSGSLDLNDSAGNFEATNFDRLNELQNSLKILNLGGCNINTLPSTFIQLYLLESLAIGGNNTFTTLSPNLPINIKYLDLERKPTKLTSWVNFDRLTNLETLRFRDNTGADEDIPIGVEIAECKKLKTVVQKQIDNTIRDKFILNWYNFVTANANLNPSDASIDQNKFRDMTFSASVAINALTGTYQAPTGFVQGSDNGNPTTPEERIYVLVENYGHTWNVAGTIYEQI